MTFHERKQLRAQYYETFIKGWKLRKCTSCNGTGIYDNFGSPPCAACDGTGKELYKPAPVAHDGMTTSVKHTKKIGD